MNGSLCFFFLNLIIRELYRIYRMYYYLLSHVENKDKDINLICIPNMVLICAFLSRH